MRLWLVSASSSAVVDLNTVRLETLRGAARDAAERIALHVHSYPAWFDADDRACWGFALGEAYAALDRALCATSRETGCAPLDAYHEARAAVARVACWCIRRAEPRSRCEDAAALAFDTAADELAPILCHADRAPRWLRERARQGDAARVREAFDPW